MYANPDDLSVFDFMEPIPNWTAGATQALTSNTSYSERFKTMSKKRILEIDMAIQMFLDFDYEGPPMGIDLPEHALKDNGIIPGLFEFGSQQAQGHEFSPTIDLSQAKAWPETSDDEDERFLPPGSEIMKPSLDSLVEIYGPPRVGTPVTPAASSLSLSFLDGDDSSSDDDDDEDNADGIQSIADASSANDDRDETLSTPVPTTSERENLRDLDQALLSHFGMLPTPSPEPPRRVPRARPSYVRGNLRKPNVARHVLPDVTPFRRQARQGNQRENLQGHKKHRESVKVASKNTRKPPMTPPSARKARRPRAPAIRFIIPEIVNMLEKKTTRHQPQLCLNKPLRTSNIKGVSGWKCQKRGCDDVARTPAAALAHALVHLRVNIVCRGCFIDCGENLANFKKHVVKARAQDPASPCVLAHRLISTSVARKEKNRIQSTTMDEEIGAVGNAIFLERNSQYTEGGRLVVIKWT